MPLALLLNHKDVSLLKCNTTAHCNKGTEPNGLSTIGKEKRKAVSVTRRGILRSFAQHHKNRRQRHHHHWKERMNKRAYDIKPFGDRTVEEGKWLKNNISSGFSFLLPSVCLTASRIAGSFCSFISFLPGLDSSTLLDSIDVHQSVDPLTDSFFPFPLCAPLFPLCFLIVRLLYPFFTIFGRTDCWPTSWLTDKPSIRVLLYRY